MDQPEIMNVGNRSILCTHHVQHRYEMVFAIGFHHGSRRFTKHCRFAQDIAVQRNRLDDGFVSNPSIQGN